MASTKARRGKDGKVQWGTTILGVKLWEVVERGDDLDTTNTLSQGLDEGLVGVKGCEIRLEMDWDAGKNPHDDPPGIFVRDDGGPVKFWENATDNIFWNFPVVRVLEATNGGPVRGLISYNCRIKSNGAYTPPAGSV
jgi:hypothetical protein